MARTVLVTGASRGIGRTTVQLFAERGWNVVATLRDLEQGRDLAEQPHVAVARLDVEDEVSVREGIDAGIEAFGALDVVVNNAGFGVFGALEAIPPESMLRQFEVNVFGMLRVTRAALSHFRQRGEGLFIQMSSVAGRVPFPLGGVYNASKFAVEGLSEALVFELETVGARLKIVEPGVIATDALGSSLVVHEDASLDAYRGIHASLLAAFEASGAVASPATLVAECIYGAATDGSEQLRYVVGPDAAAMLARRAELDDASFLAWLKTIYRL